MDFIENPLFQAHSQAHALRVNSVSTELVGQGFPSTVVKVKATFSNSCHVARSEELVVVPQYAGNYEDLVLTLAVLPPGRMCPAVYRPVTVTFDLGQYTKPNDGTFRKVTVNGVDAK